jgi:hypothetical protein
MRQQAARRLIKIRVIRAASLVSFLYPFVACLGELVSKKPYRLRARHVEHPASGHVQRTFAAPPAIHCMDRCWPPGARIRSSEPPWCSIDPYQSMAELSDQPSRLA